MAQNSKIEWTDHTANYWWGCTRVSDGCKFCYADATAKWRGKTIWGPTADREAKQGVWSDVYRWDAEAKRDGVKRKVFTSSMADFFEGPETCQDAAAYAMIANARHRVFTEVIPNTPNLIHLLLTKRPGNILKMVPQSWRERFPDNVWVGTSVEDQKAADERIPVLLQVPAAVRFLSCEPLLGPVDLSAWIPAGARRDSVKWPDGFDNFSEDAKSEFFVNTSRWIYMARCEIGIHWVIAGGESGPSARPMHPDWARQLRDQCAEAGTPFFFKQHGEYVCSEGCEEEGDIQFRSDGVITGKVTEVRYATHPTVKEARLKVAREIGDNGFGLSREENPIGLSTQSTVPHDENCGRYTTLRRIGKKDAGRLLDGAEWSQFPKSGGAK